ncbi:MAG: serine acetyltransferase [Parasporobacterium sp.]|nr:serine acetyltransferase [Parasporobacterium sp.]
MKYTDKITACIDKTAKDLGRIQAEAHGESPDFQGLKAGVVRMVEHLQGALYPEVFCNYSIPVGDTQGFVREKLALASEELGRLLDRVISGKDGENIICSFLQSLGQVAELMRTDIRAAYEGDPAAMSEKEVLLSYPGVEACMIYRLAHSLWNLKVPIIPRMMTEYAHSKTGIDIHPGAQIGESFFIDHGTGVVIGETCTIGHHVKLYQGVTLGAKSFDLDEEGNPVKGIKRHPDIGNYVVIYADATILGGDTVIGDNCVIGGNVWLTHSVEPGATIIHETENIEK